MCDIFDFFLLLFLLFFLSSFVSTNSRSPVQTVYVSRAGGGLGNGGSFGGGLLSTSSPTQSQVLPPYVSSVATKHFEAYTISLIDITWKYISISHDCKIVLIIFFMSPEELKQH